MLNIFTDIKEDIIADQFLSSNERKSVGDVIGNYNIVEGSVLELQHREPRNDEENYEIEVGVRYYGRFPEGLRRR